MHANLSGIFVRFCFVLALFFISCNKEIDNEKDIMAAIRGQWLFMSNSVITESVTTYTVDGVVFRNKVTANYVTYNNDGNVTIVDGIMTGTDIRFDVITNSYFSFYVGNDNEEDSVEVPFTNYMDSAYTVQRSFVIVRPDSVYFPQGTLMNIPDINGEERSSGNIPQGGTIRWFDNAMKITTSSTDDYSFVEGGTTYQVIKKEQVEVNLSKLN